MLLQPVESLCCANNKPVILIIFIIISRRPCFLFQSLWGNLSKAFSGLAVLVSVAGWGSEVKEGSL